MALFRKGSKNKNVGVADPSKKGTTTSPQPTVLKKASKKKKVEPSEKTSAAQEDVAANINADEGKSGRGSHRSSSSRRKRKYDSNERRSHSRRSNDEHNNRHSSRRSYDRTSQERSKKSGSSHSDDRHIGRYSSKRSGDRRSEDKIKRPSTSNDRHSSLNSSRRSDDRRSQDRSKRSVSSPSNDRNMSRNSSRRIDYRGSKDGSKRAVSSRSNDRNISRNSSRRSDHRRSQDRSKRSVSSRSDDRNISRNSSRRSDYRRSQERSERSGSNRSFDGRTSRKSSRRSSDSRPQFISAKSSQPQTTSDPIPTEEDIQRILESLAEEVKEAEKKEYQFGQAVENAPLTNRLVAEMSDNEDFSDSELLRILEEVNMLAEQEKSANVASSEPALSLDDESLDQDFQKMVEEVKLMVEQEKNAEKGEAKTGPVARATNDVVVGQLGKKEEQPLNMSVKESRQQATEDIPRSPTSIDRADTFSKALPSPRLEKDDDVLNAEDQNSANSEENNAISQQESIPDPPVSPKESLSMSVDVATEDVQGNPSISETDNVSAEEMSLHRLEGGLEKEESFEENSISLDPGDAEMERSITFPAGDAESVHDSTGEDQAGAETREDTQGWPCSKQGVSAVQEKVDKPQLVSSKPASLPSKDEYGANSKDDTEEHNAISQQEPVVLPQESLSMSVDVERGDVQSNPSSSVGNDSDNDLPLHVQKGSLEESSLDSTPGDAEMERSTTFTAGDTESVPRSSGEVGAGTRSMEDASESQRSKHSVVSAVQEKVEKSQVVSSEPILPSEDEYGANSKDDSEERNAISQQGSISGPPVSAISQRGSIAGPPVSPQESMSKPVVLETENDLSNLSFNDAGSDSAEDLHVRDVEMGGATTFTARDTESVPDHSSEVGGGTGTMEDTPQKQLSKHIASGVEEKIEKSQVVSSVPAFALLGEDEYSANYEDDTGESNAIPQQGSIHEPPVPARSQAVFSEPASPREDEYGATSKDDTEERNAISQQGAISDLPMSPQECLSKPVVVESENVQSNRSPFETSDELGDGMSIGLASGDLDLENFSTVTADKGKESVHDSSGESRTGTETTKDQPESPRPKRKVSAFQNLLKRWENLASEPGLQTEDENGANSKNDSRGNKVRSQQAVVPDPPVSSQESSSKPIVVQTEGDESNLTVGEHKSVSLADGDEEIKRSTSLSTGDAESAHESTGEDRAGNETSEETPDCPRSEPTSESGVQERGETSKVDAPNPVLPIDDEYGSNPKDDTEGRNGSLQQEPLHDPPVSPQEHLSKSSIVAEEIRSNPPFRETGDDSAEDVPLHSEERSLCVTPADAEMVRSTTFTAEDTESVQESSGEGGADTGTTEDTLESQLTEHSVSGVEDKTEKSQVVSSVAALPSEDEYSPNYELDTGESNAISQQGSIPEPQVPAQEPLSRPVDVTEAIQSSPSLGETGDELAEDMSIGLASGDVEKEFSTDAPPGDTESAHDSTGEDRAGAGTTEDTQESQLSKHSFSAVRETVVKSQVASSEPALSTEDQYSANSKDDSGESNATSQQMSIHKASVPPQEFQPKPVAVVKEDVQSSPSLGETGDELAEDMSIGLASGDVEKERSTHSPAGEKESAHDSTGNDRAGTGTITEVSPESQRSKRIVSRVEEKLEKAQNLPSESSGLPTEDGNGKDDTAENNSISQHEAGPIEDTQESQLSKHSFSAVQEKMMKLQVASSEPTLSREDQYSASSKDDSGESNATSQQISIHEASVPPQESLPKPVAVVRDDVQSNPSPNETGDELAEAVSIGLASGDVEKERSTHSPAGDTESEHDSIGKDRAGTGTIIEVTLESQRSKHNESTVEEKVENLQNLPSEPSGLPTVDENGKDDTAENNSTSQHEAIPDGPPSSPQESLSQPVDIGIEGLQCSSSLGETSDRLAEDESTSLARGDEETERSSITSGVTQSVHDSTGEDRAGTGTTEGTPDCPRSESSVSSVHEKVEKSSFVYSDPELQIEDENGANSKDDAEKEHAIPQQASIPGPLQGSSSRSIDEGIEDIQVNPFMSGTGDDSTGDLRALQMRELLLEDEGWFEDNSSGSVPGDVELERSITFGTGDIKSSYDSTCKGQRVTGATEDTSDCFQEKADASQVSSDPALPREDECGANSKDGREEKHAFSQQESIPDSPGTPHESFSEPVNVLGTEDAASNSSIIGTGDELSDAESSGLAPGDMEMERSTASTAGDAESVHDSSDERQTGTQRTENASDNSFSKTGESSFEEKGEESQLACDPSLASKDLDDSDSERGLVFKDKETLPDETDAAIATHRKLQGVSLTSTEREEVSTEDETGDSKRLRYQGVNKGELHTWKEESSRNNGQRERQSKRDGNSDEAIPESEVDAGHLKGSVDGKNAEKRKFFWSSNVEEEKNMEGTDHDASYARRTTITKDGWDHGIASIPLTMSDGTSSEEESNPESVDNKSSSADQPETIVEEETLSNRLEIDRGKTANKETKLQSGKGENICLGEQETAMREDDSKKAHKPLPGPVSSEDIAGKETSPVSTMSAFERSRAIAAILRDETISEEEKKSRIQAFRPAKRVTRTVPVEEVKQDSDEVARRKVIQRFHADKSLTPHEKHEKIQAVLKGGPLPTPSPEPKEHQPADRRKQPPSQFPPRIDRPKDFAYPRRLPANTDVDQVGQLIPKTTRPSLVDTGKGVSDHSGLTGDDSLLDLSDTGKNDRDIRSKAIAAVHRDAALTSEEKHSKIQSLLRGETPPQVTDAPSRGAPVAVRRISLLDIGKEPSAMSISPGPASENSKEVWESMRDVTLEPSPKASGVRPSLVDVGKGSSTMSAISLHSEETEISEITTPTLRLPRNSARAKDRDERAKEREQRNQAMREVYQDNSLTPIEKQEKIKLLMKNVVSPAPATTDDNDHDSATTTTI
eukprot:scaffold725_cov133-Cylindrotheca_fusiformis.AAC.1